MPRRDPYDPTRMIAKNYLGDHIANALKSVGVTPDRVEKWLGRPCGCEERREKLNALHRWVNRVILGKTEDAGEYLNEIMGEGRDNDQGNNQPTEEPSG